MFGGDGVAIHDKVCIKFRCGRFSIVCDESAHGFLAQIFATHGRNNVFDHQVAQIVGQFKGERFEIETPAVGVGSGSNSQANNLPSSNLNNVGIRMVGIIKIGERVHHFCEFRHINLFGMIITTEDAHLCSFLVGATLKRVANHRIRICRNCYLRRNQPIVATVGAMILVIHS